MKQKFTAKLIAHTGFRQTRVTIPWHDPPTVRALAWYVDVRNASYLPGGPNEWRVGNGDKPHIYSARIVRLKDNKVMAQYVPKSVYEQRA